MEQCKKNDSLATHIPICCDPACTGSSSLSDFSGNSVALPARNDTGKIGDHSSHTGRPPFTLCFCSTNIRTSKIQLPDSPIQWLPERNTSTFVRSAMLRSAWKFTRRQKHGIGAPFPEGKYFFEKKLKIEGLCPIWALRRQKAYIQKSLKVS